MPSKHHSCDLVSNNLVSDFVRLTIFNYYASQKGSKVLKGDCSLDVILVSLLEPERC